MKTARKPKTAHTKAMSELREVVLLRGDARCFRCQVIHQPRFLELHHQAGRGKAGLYNETTCIMLCRDCHRWTHDEPHAWEGELETLTPIWLKHCRNTKHVIRQHVKPAEEYERLKKLREKMERANGLS